MDKSPGFAIFPTYRSVSSMGPGGRWLYAIGFSDGRVKFGIAALPRQRIQAYWRSVGSLMQWAHVFGRAPMDDLRRTAGVQHAAERLAISKACESGQRLGRSEYVQGITRQQALECMRWAIREVEAAQARKHLPPELIGQEGAPAVPEATQARA